MKYSNSGISEEEAMNLEVWRVAYLCNGYNEVELSNIILGSISVEYRRYCRKFDPAEYLVRRYFFASVGHQNPCRCIGVLVMLLYSACLLVKD